MRFTRWGLLLRAYTLIVLSIYFGATIVAGAQTVSIPLSSDDRALKVVAFYDDIGLWAIDTSDKVLVHVNQKWLEVGQPTAMRHVSVGPAGVWAIDTRNRVYYRQGVSGYRPQGAQWTLVPTLTGWPLVPSAISEGEMLAIGPNGLLRCSYDATCTNPLGSKWRPASMTFKLLYLRYKDVSCGRRGCWGVTRDARVVFLDRPRFTDRPCGFYGSSSFISTAVGKNGNISQTLDIISVKTSPSGMRVVAVTKDGSLYKRDGLGGSIYDQSWKLVATGHYVYAVPCHMGYIAVTTNNKAVFIAEAPECKPESVRLTEVDTGGLLKSPSTWGIIGGTVYQKQGEQWVNITEGPPMKGISTSGKDIWAVDAAGGVFYRQGVTCRSPYGDVWEQVPDVVSFSQVDSGTFGLVYGVTPHGRVACREGISIARRTGSTWRLIDGNMQYVSCGDFGCWGVDPFGRVYFRVGSKVDNCAGEKWVLVTTRFPMRKIESGHHGLVFAIDHIGRIHARVATSELDPMGTSWLVLYDFKTFTDVSHAQLRIMLIDSDNIVHRCD